jgi:hypothetical protein
MDTRDGNDSSRVDAHYKSKAATFQAARRTTVPVSGRMPVALLWG